MPGQKRKGIVMLVIGIVRKNDDIKIEKLLKTVFALQKFRTAVIKSSEAAPELIRFFDTAGFDFIIISMLPGRIRPVYLDILILESTSAISYELVKCVYGGTRLIYSIDSGMPQGFDHPNAISYGMSYRAEATASSVDDKFDGISFIYCLQRPIVTLGGDTLCAGEIPIVIPGINTHIENALAAVTCGMLCGVSDFKSAKI